MLLSESNDFITGCRKYAHCFVKIFTFDEDIVGIKCGYGKDTDFIFCKNAGDFGKNADQRKIKYPLDPEPFPAVIPISCDFRSVLCSANQRKLFIGLPDEVKRFCEIEICFGRQFADCEIKIKFFQFHFFLLSQISGSDKSGSKFCSTSLWFAVHQPPVIIR